MYMNQIFYNGENIESLGKKSEIECKAMGYKVEYFISHVKIFIME